MNKEENIGAFIKTIQLAEGADFTHDEVAIFEEYKRFAANKSSLAIKILSIVGGFIAALAFLGFLFITELFESEIGLTIFGAGFIIAAVLLNKVYDKLIIDTLSISAYIIGFFLLAFGLLDLDVDVNLVTIIILCIALVSLVITQNYILSFVSLLIISGSFLTLIFYNEWHDLVHLYTLSIMLLLTYLMLNESAIITFSKKLSKLYDPIRISSILSCIIGLGIMGKKDLLPISPDYILVSSVVLFFIVLYLVSKVLEVVGIEDLTKKITIYSLSVLVLASTIFAPSILGAVLIILLSFLVNYKTGLAMGIIALIYFISQYYYDLNFTLLTKSIILFSSGILFIVFYLFVNRKVVE
ncbi:MAG: permease [Saprospiraceae bacterium]|nr:MAG: permease [Saprospiraceae bacterium]